jgi:hypothetical protein
MLSIQTRRLRKSFPAGHLPLDQNLEPLDFSRHAIPQNFNSFSGAANSSNAWPHGGPSMVSQTVKETCSMHRPPIQDQDFHFIPSGPPLLNLSESVVERNRIFVCVRNSGRLIC